MLIGNIGQDPELRFTASGTAVMNLRIATTEKYKDRDGERKERTDWHSVVVWGKRAEALEKFLRKGSRLYIEGPVQTSSYEAREGGKRYKTEINAREIILLDGKRDSNRHDAPAATDHSRRDDDNSDVPF